MGRNAPIDRFAAWLEQRVEELEPGQRLPSDRALARSWGIATKTVARIIKPYCDRDLLCRMPGKGTFAPPVSADRPEAGPAPCASWEAIAGEINAMIHAGQLKVGECFPPMKLISAQYRVTPATVIRAYRSLCRHGVAVKIGRSYFAGTFEQSIRHSAPPKRAMFYLFGKGNYSDTLRFHHLEFAFTKCEYELIRNGFRVEYRYEDHFSEQYPRWRNGDALPWGMVILAMNPALYDRFLPRLCTLTRFERVVRPRVLCVSRAAKRPPPGIDLFCTGHVFTSWGRAVAEFVTGNRFGDGTFFIDTTVPGRSYMAHVRLLAEIRHRIPDFGYRFVVRYEGTKSAFVSDLHAHYPPDHIRYIFSKQAHIRFDEVIGRTETVRDSATAYEPHAGSDVWLFSHDAHAVDALRWCGEHGVGVPRELSIVGLENNPAFAHHGLTTCTEDWDTMGYLMAHAIVGDFAVAKTRRGFVRTSALMLPRSTTP